MNIFRAKSDAEESKMSQEMGTHLETVEKILMEIRRVLEKRRNILNHTDKKLQEFQDSMYALIIEADAPYKRPARHKNDDDEDDDAAQSKQTRVDA